MLLLDGMDGLSVDTDGAMALVPISCQLHTQTATEQQLRPLACPRNTGHGHIGDQQLNWLEGELVGAASRGTNITAAPVFTAMAFFRIPPAVFGNR